MALDNANKITVFLIILCLLLSPTSVGADTWQAIVSTGVAEASPVICLPGIYMTLPADCTPAGPSLSLTSMAHLGLYYPERPLPAENPDPELSRMPTTYVTTHKEAVPLFDSLSAASAMSPSQTLSPGMKYLSIDQRLEQDNVVYYHLTSGAWVEGGSAGTGCCIYAGRFQGLLFSRTPTSDFGWFVDEGWSRASPTSTSPANLHHYYRESVVPVYDTRHVR